MTLNEFIEELNRIIDNPRILQVQEDDGSAYSAEKLEGFFDGLKYVRDRLLVTEPEAQYEDDIRN